jgi:hypothetical protein
VVRIAVDLLAVRTGQRVIAAGAEMKHRGLVEVGRRRRRTLEVVVRWKVDRLERLVVNQALGRICSVEARSKEVHCREMVHELLVVGSYSGR